MHDDDQLDAIDIAGVAGITYRQLDYWTNRGFLRSTNTATGRGRPRQYHRVEQHVAAVMARLTAGGIPATAAAVYARDYVERGITTFTLGGGITLKITPDGAS